MMQKTMSCYHIGIFFPNFRQKIIIYVLTIKGTLSIHMFIQLLHSSCFSSKKLLLHFRFFFQLCEPVFLCRIRSFLICYFFFNIQQGSSTGAIRGDLNNLKNWGAILNNWGAISQLQILL